MEETIFQEVRQEKSCSSCNTMITNQVGSVSFKCPKCSKLEIIRCPICRKSVAKYTCASCGFTGPN